MHAHEDPTEKIQEHMQEHVHGHGAAAGWQQWVALSAAVIAAFAAVTSLLAGARVNEAMISQIKSSDTWAFYQAKSIKSSLLKTKVDILQAQGVAVKKEDTDKLASYENDKEKLNEEATHLQHEAESLLKEHERFAHSVTFLQIGIAVCAMSVLSKKRRFWLAGLGFAFVGTVFFILGWVL